MSDDLGDWIAEDMWRKARSIGNRRRAAYATWLGLTEASIIGDRWLKHCSLPGSSKAVPSKLSEQRLCTSLC